MTVLNADGSRPEMCGNGLRCVALHLAQRDGAQNTRYLVDTDAGPRECEVTRRDSVAEVTISMGQAVPLGGMRAEYQGRAYEFHRVSTGNPHTITFDAELDVQAIDRFAAEISAGIAGGSNVEFVRQKGPHSFQAVIWERGVGRTLACGTGACALAAAAVEQGRASLGEPLSIELPGGVLVVTVVAPGLSTVMRGPAREVFRGRIAS
jgi:diaminopimelate epimerase